MAPTRLAPFLLLCDFERNTRREREPRESVVGASPVFNSHIQIFVVTGTIWLTS